MSESAPSERPGARSPAGLHRRHAGPGRLLLYVGIGAAALHAAFDAITAQIPLLSPPYLRLSDAPEEFQMLSPVAVSIAVCCVSGIIAVISVAAVLPEQRRPALLAGMITGFWLFSAVLLRVVWLSTPWGMTLIALVPGFVRGAVIGWFAASVAGPGVSGRRGGAV